MGVFASVKSKGATGALVLGLAALAGCVTNQVTVPGIDVSVPVPRLPIPGIPFLGRGEGDLRHLTWANAFLAMHTRMEREYPFTEHKGIDWDMLRETYYPLVRAAENNRDAQAYYITIREFLYQLPDGHVGMSVEDRYRDADIAGGYGFAVKYLDDGRVIAHVILEDGPAAAAGMAWGAEILTWDGEPMVEALLNAPMIWADNPAGTPQARLTFQERLRVRAPLDTALEVTFRNPGAEELDTVVLSAYDDDFATWEATSPPGHDVDLLESPLTHRMLDERLGYIRLFAVAPTVATPFFDKAFAGALQRLMDEGAEGLVVDLRGNRGGVSALAALAAGHFHGEAAHYEDMAYYNPREEAFTIAEDERIVVRPRSPQFQGPIVVLTDEYTADAGEGLAWALVRLAGAEVAAYGGTAASFTNTGGGVTLHRGHTVFYPVGRSLDEDGNIQLESDGTGEGGIKPTIRPTFDEDTVRAIHLEGRDPVLEAAVVHLEAQR